CGVVAQRAQFSFVRRGHIPTPNRASQPWRRAVAIARIAATQAHQRLLPESTLWYHASYVRPSWGRRLDRSGQIGAHIFYR
ncbi:MAG TPA: cell wall hydrolase, partial [Allosphingosinicella sp.]|nr:cell wall hydrolase [Allosphingosinicella sp.]